LQKDLEAHAHLKLQSKHSIKRFIALSKFKTMFYKSKYKGVAYSNIFFKANIISKLARLSDRTSSCCAGLALHRFSNLV